MKLSGVKLTLRSPIFAVILTETLAPEAAALHKASFRPGVNLTRAAVPAGGPEAMLIVVFLVLITMYFAPEAALQTRTQQSEQGTQQKSGKLGLCDLIQLVEMLLSISA